MILLSVLVFTLKTGGAKLYFMNKKITLKIFSLILLISLSSGCATWRKLNNTEKGGAIGGGTGLVIGAAVGGPVGCVIGGAAGAFCGAVIGGESR